MGATRRWRPTADSATNRRPGSCSTRPSSLKCSRCAIVSWKASRSSRELRLDRNTAPHDVPGSSGSFDQDAEHGFQAPLVVQQNLMSSGRAPLDGGSMAGVGFPDIQAGNPIQRRQIRSQVVLTLPGVRNEGADPGQHVIAGEQPARSRIAQTHVIGLMARGEDDFQMPAATQWDPVAIFDRMGWLQRFRKPDGTLKPSTEPRHCLRGSSTLCDEASEVVPARAPVVVVRNLSLRGAVHHPFASGRADDALGHAHVVDMEMGPNQPLQVGDRETEACQRPVEHVELFGPVDTAVQQRQPPVPFKEVTVDGSRVGKGKRQRDPVDTVAERVGNSRRWRRVWRRGHVASRARPAIL